jgi:hypothetical protein
MQLTVVVPGSLLPRELASEIARELQAPALTRRLAHARLQDEREIDWIATHVFGGPMAPPTAPYAWAALADGGPTTRAVWHADPVHIAVGRDTLVLHELPTPPEPAEADALFAAADEPLREAGWALQRAAQRWFLLGDRDWSMSPRSLEAASGHALDTARPDHADARQWARLHNEIQMRWHDHPVNQRREARGELPINALWLHGGGRWRHQPPLRWARVHSGRAELRGVAAAAGAIVAGADDAIGDRALLVWDDAAAAGRTGDWSRWLAAMSAVDRRLDTLPRSATLEIVLSGHNAARTFLARPSDWLRPWRRTSLVQALTQ